MSAIPNLTNLDETILDCIAMHLGDDIKSHKSYGLTCKHLRSHFLSNEKYFQAALYILTHYKIMATNIGSIPLWLAVKNKFSLLLGEGHLPGEKEVHLGLIRLAAKCNNLTLLYENISREELSDVPFNAETILWDNNDEVLSLYPQLRFIHNLKICILTFNFLNLKFPRDPISFFQTIKKIRDQFPCNLHWLIDVLANPTEVLRMTPPKQLSAKEIQHAAICYVVTRSLLIIAIGNQLIKNIHADVISYCQRFRRVSFIRDGIFTGHLYQQLEKNENKQIITVSGAFHNSSDSFIIECLENEKKLPFVSLVTSIFGNKRGITSGSHIELRDYLEVVMEKFQRIDAVEMGEASLQRKKVAVMCSLFNPIALFKREFTQIAKYVVLGEIQKEIRFLTGDQQLLPEKK